MVVLSFLSLGTDTPLALIMFSPSATCTACIHGGGDLLATPAYTVHIGHDTTVQTLVSGCM